MGNGKGMYYIRIVAGLYICYVAVKLIMGLINGTDGMHPAIAVISAVVFLACGAYFAISSIKYLYQHRNDTVEPSADDKMEDLEEAEESLESLSDKTEAEVEVAKAEEAVEQAKETLEEKMERLKGKDLDEVLAETTENKR